VKISLDGDTEIEIAGLGGGIEEHALLEVKSHYL